MAGQSPAGWTDGRRIRQGLVFSRVSYRRTPLDRIWAAVSISLNLCRTR